jgi:hypothetical protein
MIEASYNSHGTKHPPEVIKIYEFSPFSNLSSLGQVRTRPFIGMLDVVLLVPFFLNV